MGEIRLGTSGYSFGGWRGTVYPSDIKPSGMFAYYLEQFRLNSVEINYTYYQMPSYRVFAAYDRKTPNDFRFAVKLFSGITHTPWIKPGVPGLDSDGCTRFMDAVSPLAQSGKLGCVLAQFPPHMKPCPAAWDFILGLRSLLKGCSLVCEFRHRAWVTEHTLVLLRRAGIGYCAVDEPQVGPLMPLVPAVTSEIGYLRLHGRNPTWFEPSSLRYDYLYSSDELEALLPVVKSMSAHSSVLYIQFNNCHAGSAVKNVKMMQYLLDLDIPPLQGVLFG